MLEHSPAPAAALPSGDGALCSAAPAPAAASCPTLAVGRFILSYNCAHSDAHCTARLSGQPMIVRFPQQHACFESDEIQHFLF